MRRITRRMAVIVAVVIVGGRLFALRMSGGIVMTQRDAQASARGCESLDGHRQRQGAGEDEPD